MNGKATKTDDRETMRDEYDFSGGVRGKYYRAYTEGTNVVVLDPDVAARFKNAHAVNEALRAVLKAAEQSQT
jgi:hypothetical protein